MLLRIAIILILICILCRWALGRWPWQYMSAQPPRSQVILNARKLLNVEKGASRDEIMAAHKRRIAMVHPDRGGSSAEVHAANDARDVLIGELPPGEVETIRDDASQD
ncbi:molecular chaperone DnaJ [Erythrobacter sp. KY5]|uniref:J domain-containing protein n=1 Tax=Erythrobacter sp. KY5 TaxID=2011159 RepID=UPI000DBF039D|nr:J domain-containing protein [Erythrobacter sp. KY5]AWW73085.1 molecular chaperone DnaJ [Erythrobacter sp. KY5]